jgi:hypothetical protein
MINQILTDRDTYLINLFNTYNGRISCDNFIKACNYDSDLIIWVLMMIERNLVSRDGDFYVLVNKG